MQDDGMGTRYHLGVELGRVQQREKELAARVAELEGTDDRKVIESVRSGLSNLRREIVDLALPIALAVLFLVVDAAWLIAAEGSFLGLLFAVLSLASLAATSFKLRIILQVRLPAIVRSLGSPPS